MGGRGGNLDNDNNDPCQSYEGILISADYQMQPGCYSLWLAQIFLESEYDIALNLLFR